MARLALRILFQLNYFLIMHIGNMDCGMTNIPIIIHPKNNTILEVEPDSELNITCKALIRHGLSTGDSMIYWLLNYTFFDNYADVAEHKVTESPSEEGLYLECHITIHTMIAKFYNTPFTCVVISTSGEALSNVYLQLPKPPGLAMWRITLTVLILVTCFTLGTVCFCNIFKTDIVLFYRDSCRRKEATEDGKMYDAYVVYPKVENSNSTFPVDVFALEKLPQVLETHCEYCLFIPGRDKIPRGAAVDVVEDCIQESRRLIMLLTSACWGDGKEQAMFEQHIGLYDALIQNKIKVILIELERIADYTNMPESIKYIKQKQGTIVWKENFTESSFSPKTKFWKTVRCQMPPQCRSKSYLYNRMPSPV